MMAILLLLNVSLFLMLIFNVKGGDSVRAVYVALIVNGRMTINNVAKPLQAVVLQDLKVLGLDGNGNPLDSEVVMAA